MFSKISSISRIIFTLSFFFVSLIISISLFSDGCSGCQFDDIDINKYEATYKFNSDGSCDVIESYNYNYQGNYTAKYRDLNLRKTYVDSNGQHGKSNGYASINLNEVEFEVIVDGKKLSLGDINTNRYNNSYQGYYGVTGQIDEMGNIIECDPNYGHCESLFVYVPSGFTNDTTFIYKYRIENIMNIYNDIAEFNWNLFSYCEGNIKEGEVNFILPKNSVNDFRIYGRGESKTNNIEIIDEKNAKVTFTDFSNSSSLEIRILSDKDIYNVANSNSIYNFNAKDLILDFEAYQAEYQNARIAKFAQVKTLTIVAIVITLGLAVLMYFKFDKEYKAEFDQEYVRELPDKNLTPAEMSYLYYFGHIYDEDITATLLDLVRKKYLKITPITATISDKDSDFKIELINNNLDNLKSHERHLITWFINHIGDGKVVKMSDIKYFNNVEKNAINFVEKSKQFNKLASYNGKKHNFIETQKNKSIAYLLAIIPAAILFYCIIVGNDYNLGVGIYCVATFIVILFYVLYVSLIKKRTKYGNEEFAKWKAFKKYLEEFAELSDDGMLSIVLWEEYLAYATSLKIADTVMKQLKVKLEQNKVTDLDSSTYLYYPHSHHNVYNFVLFHNINNCYSQARSIGQETILREQAKRVSSSGSGGGFSGGSSFGGGGGGGRSR